MRGTIASCAILVLLIGTADAEQCPPGALGVSRTLVVDPNEHPRVGSMQYSETLPLDDHEVVLTFDDGPLPRYTNSVLETLASECVKATFFMVGQMARAYPWMVRRVHDEGHTVANHTQNHPIRKMSVEQAAREIEEGFASLREAIGDSQAVSPFFRIPGLLRQKSVEQYLAAHGDMTWSADFLADDWTRINNSEVARRAISRIEARGSRSRKDLAKAHGWADYDVEIMDTQAPQVSSSTSPEPMAATILLRQYAPYRHGVAHCYCVARDHRAKHTSSTSPERSSSSTSFRTSART